jgi:ATP-binding cassette subfamily B protein
MSNFTHYTQLDQMDCGPTCLRMVAKHYGRSYSLQTLRDKTQIGKEGVSLLGIAEAAEAIGFRTLGAKISYQKLVSEAPLPCIVHWQQNHFVVVYQVQGSRSWMNRIRGGRQPKSKPPGGAGDNIPSVAPAHSFPAVTEDEMLWPGRTLPPVPSGLPNGTVCVADPGKGLVTYTAAEFCRHWLSSQAGGQAEGIALLLEPTPAFYESSQESVPAYGFSRLLTYLWQYKKMLLQLLLGLVVSSGLQLMLPFLTQSVVDVGINTQNVSFVYLVLGAQLMLMAGRLTADFIRSWILLYISTRINLSILSDFLIKLMRLPLPFFDTKHLGDLMQRVGDHDRIESFLTGQTLTVLFSLVNLLIFGVVLAFYQVTIFGIFLIGSLLYIGWVVLFLRQRRKLDFRRFGVAAKSQGSLVQLLQGMAEIRLAGAARPMRWAWERLQVSLFRLQMKNLALSQYQQAGAFALNEGKNILITCLAAQAVIAGQITLGAMLAVQYILGQLNGPIEQLVGFAQGWQDAKISLERMNEIHTLADEEPADRVLLQQVPEEAGLRLNQVSFQYPGAGNLPVLQRIDLVIPAGRTTAIVGMSGSGKTTLLKLLLRFYEPTQGEIRLGGTALAHVSQAVWRDHCGAVMQDGFIFSDTVARNIAVGVERIELNQLDRAVRVANLQELVDGLPLGYHTKIGPEGMGISQGQRQRILIARAVYKDPRYLLFDEATNALDANNEAAILERLGEFFRGRTVVVVAHRLSTVRNADQIVVLHKGVITEVGTHAELVARQGDYWQLVKNQLELGA